MNMNTSLIIRDHLLIRWLMVESVCDIDQDPWQSSNYYINTTPDGKQEIMDHGC